MNISQADLNSAWEVFKDWRSFGEGYRHFPGMGYEDQFFGEHEVVSLPLSKLDVFADYGRRPKGKRLEKPVIVVKVGQRYVVLDGQHRVHALRERGVKKIDAVVVLDAAQSRRRTRGRNPLSQLREISEKHNFDALLTAAYAWLQANQLPQDVAELRDMVPFFKRHKTEIIGFVDEVVAEHPELADTPYDEQLPWVANAYEAWVEYEADLPEPGATPLEIQAILVHRYPIIVDWSAEANADLREMNIFEILDASAEWAQDDFYRELVKARGQQNPGQLKTRPPKLKARLLR